MTKGTLAAGESFTAADSELDMGTVKELFWFGWLGFENMLLRVWRVLYIYRTGADEQKQCAQNYTILSGCWDA